MRQIRECLICLLVCAILYSSTPGLDRLLFAQQDSGTVQTQVVTISAELRGKVLFPDGKTPAPKVAVRVWSVQEKKFVHETYTDEDGSYKVPALSPGRYVAVYDDRVQVDILVVAGKEPVVRFLNVVIPRGVILLTREQVAAQLAASAPGTAPGLMGTVVAAVAGGGLVAVAVAGLAGGFGGGGGGGGVVSP